MSASDPGILLTTRPRDPKPREAIAGFPSTVNLPEARALEEDRRRGGAEPSERAETEDVVPDAARTGHLHDGPPAIESGE